MSGLETDQVISGPMRGLEKKTHGKWTSDRPQTDRHFDSMTNPAQRVRSVKIKRGLLLFYVRRCLLYEYIVIYMTIV